MHFATHRLLAGESEQILKAKAEPGLIFTPPDKASELDDGLLTASEITLLKLDADWVILSACNTAGGGTEGAQALSGLARAFFYAGTRALLVSHWAVYSDATVKLITGALSQMAQNESIGRSEALRRAMLELLEKGKPHEAHPSYWAPFVLVGEGAPARHRSATIDGNQGRMGLGVVSSETIATRTEPQTAASRTIPLPKRRPRLAWKFRKRVPRKEKLMGWPSRFWEISASR